MSDLVRNTPFTTASLNTHNYFSVGKILGNPVEIATDVFTQITAIILDDNQVVTKGTTNLANKDVRVVALLQIPILKLRGFNIF